MSPATRRPTSGSAGRRSPPKGGPPMLIGAHWGIRRQKPEADLAFFRDVLKLPSIDDGGYVIFGLPPAEVSVHESEGAGHALFLMCDDIHAFLTEMHKHKIDCGPVQDQGWGVLTEVTLPSGGKLHVYQPPHKRPNPAASPLPPAHPLRRWGRRRRGGTTRGRGTSAHAARSADPPRLVHQRQRRRRGRPRAGGHVPPPPRNSQCRATGADRPPRSGVISDEVLQTLEQARATGAPRCPGSPAVGRSRLTTPTDSGRIAARWQGHCPRRAIGGKKSAGTVKGLYVNYAPRTKRLMKWEHEASVRLVWPA